MLGEWLQLPLHIVLALQAGTTVGVGLISVAPGLATEEVFRFEPGEVDVLGNRWAPAIEVMKV